MAKQLGRQSEGQAGVGRTERETGERRQSRSVRFRHRPALPGEPPHLDRVDKPAADTHPQVSSLKPGDEGASFLSPHRGHVSSSSAPHHPETSGAGTSDNNGPTSFSPREPLDKPVPRRFRSFQTATPGARRLGVSATCQERMKSSRRVSGLPGLARAAIVGWLAGKVEAGAGAGAARAGAGQRWPSESTSTTYRWAGLLAPVVTSLSYHPPIFSATRIEARLPG